MGSRGQYSSSNRFAAYFEPQYHKAGEIGGIKVLAHNSGANAKLPEYAKTADAYISINGRGEKEHLRIYEGHRPVLEIDLGHPHHHGLKDGDVHVHTYATGADGHPQRSKTSRSLTDSEKKKYGKILDQMKRSMK